MKQTLTAVIILAGAALSAIGMNAGSHYDLKLADVKTTAIHATPIPQTPNCAWFREGVTQ